MSAFFSKAVTAVKDAYLWLVDWIDDNPQKSLWIGFALIVAGLLV